MELKRWKEYNKHEKEDILLHYLLYYIDIESVNDLEHLRKIIKNDKDKLFLYCLLDYLLDGPGPIVLIELSKNNNLNKVLSNIEKIKINDKDKMEFLNIIISNLNMYESPNTTLKKMIKHNWLKIINLVLLLMKERI